MTTGHNLWDVEVWQFILTMTILFGSMMLANILRNTIKPIRQFMIPSSVLGGFLLLGVSFCLKRFASVELFETATLETITYHGLGLGFVALALRRTEKKDIRTGRGGGFDAGVTVVATYLIQAVVGMIITLLCYKWIGSFFASGLLLPMGYGQGPGQAYNWGSNFEKIYGFTSGTSFGLTVAAMGFISASIGGIFYLNRLRKKHLLKGEIGRDVKDASLTAEQITGENEIPLSESMDKFTVQLSLVFIAYVCGYLFMRGVDLLIEKGYLGNFGVNTVRPLIWGFNFLIGTIFALILKGILNKLRKANVIKRDYVNNFMLNRISGFMFDLMVVASIAAVDLSAFTNREFIIPLTLICVAGAVVTYFFLDRVCKTVYRDIRHEAFLSLYGMATGTASTGLILLREVDEKFESRAATNLVYHQPWAIVFGFPMMLMMSFAPQSITNTLITLGVCTVLFVAMLLINFRYEVFKKYKNKKK